MSDTIDTPTRVQKMLDLEHACILEPNKSDTPSIVWTSNHCRAMAHKYQWQFEFDAVVADWLRRWPGVTAKPLDEHRFELTNSFMGRATVHQHRTWWAVCVSHTKYNGPVRDPSELFGRSPATYTDEGYRILVEVPVRKKLGRMTKWSTKTIAKTGTVELPPTFDTSIEAMRQLKRSVEHIERTTAYKFTKDKEGEWGWDAPRIK